MIAVGESGYGDVEVRVGRRREVGQLFGEVFRGGDAGGLRIGLLQTARLVDQQQHLAGMLRGETRTEAVDAGVGVVGGGRIRR